MTDAALDLPGPPGGAPAGLDRAGNELFHALRLGTLLTLLGDLSDRAAPLFVLDAGCGTGYFARALDRCGHRVDAVDADEEAVERARAAGDGPRYSRARPDEWRGPWPYDVVLCADVLGRLRDDTERTAALRNLASQVRLTGRLIVTDTETPVPRTRGDRVRHRPAACCRAALEPLGLRHTESRPYGFREVEAGFHVFTRIR
ncbi:class I SAM-dependent methyltransferase [Streptomyces sp. NPDC038707]|uniref:class I SAM-dependent methyltransferase n=1 Tax=unclassified Streptomyces TaxID=2593676 RepID=UPI0033D9D0ED